MKNKLALISNTQSQNTTNNNIDIIHTQNLAYMMHAKPTLETTKKLNLVLINLVKFYACFKEKIIDKMPKVSEKNKKKSNSQYPLQIE